MRASGERAVLVGVSLKEEAGSLEPSLKELERLTETAGGRVVGVVRQRLERFHPGTLIGEGKVRELALEAARHKAKTVIVDRELSPAQQKSLEARVPAKILDRTRLILDIFAQRARTKEGELQVELAQLSYMLPRLTGRWRAYSQQVGGIGTRGPGERQLEYERRHIQRRIAHLKGAIAALRRERQVQRDRRRSVPVPQIAIIGYTNVGKSTLLNALMSQASPGGRRAVQGDDRGKVYSDDKLFATLDPTTRRVRLPEGGWAVFTDTVGFIRNLPTTLVAAFHSTLEEVTLADCLLHVHDAAAEDMRAQSRAVRSVLSELGADKLPVIEALNKADLVSRDALRRLEDDQPHAVLVSASLGRGLKELLARIQEALHDRWVLRELDLDPGDHRLVQEAYRSAQVLEHAFKRGRLRLRLRITPENWDRLKTRVTSRA